MRKEDLENLTPVGNTELMISNIKQQVKYLTSFSEMISKHRQRGGVNSQNLAIKPDMITDILKNKSIMICFYGLSTL